jgi:hypothetical protein
MRLEMMGQLKRLVAHTFAAETLEAVYCRCTESEQREFVLSFYDNYKLPMQATVEDNKTVSLKRFIELKPQLGEDILTKLD